MKTKSITAPVKPANLPVPTLVEKNAELRLSARKVWLWSIAGSGLLWAAFPPVNLGWLGWFATIPWIVLALRTESILRGGYGIIWLASWLHWAALLQGVRLAHPALYPGWLVLSAYLAIYPPLFIGLSRSLLRHGNLPAVLVLPIVWTALEYARAYIVTGFSTASLSHTQVDFPYWLQIADIAGAYSLSFVMMFATTALVLWWPRLACSWPTRLGSSIAALLLLAATLGYGYYRLHEQYAAANGARPTVRVLLVQGCVDTVLDNNPERPREMLNHYQSLTFDQLAKDARYDLIVWPETVFAYPDLIAEPTAQPPPESGLNQEKFQQQVAAHQALLKEILTYFSARMNESRPAATYFLTGISTTSFSGTEAHTYNATLLVSPAGEPLSRYYKSHLVMFGEYIPIAEWFPWIYRLTPLPGGLSRGTGPQAFTINKLTFSPNICFESTVPQLIRRQVNSLEDRYEEPDVLINATNDGWFYGSAILDLHFQCAVLRAIENRKPLLIAANTGISGVIDGNGRVLQHGPNHATALLTAEVQADGRQSIYRTIGDWPAFLCLLVTTIASVVVWRKSKSTSRGLVRDKTARM